MAIKVVSGDAAVANVTSQPANLLLYGGPGMGKTTDAVGAFTDETTRRCSAFYIPCEDGALKGIAARGLAIPDHTEAPVKTWADMLEALNYVHANRARYNAVIIDTLSTFTSYLQREREEANKNNKNKYQTPTDMRQMMFMLREWTRALNVHCVMVAHAVPPETYEGVTYKGGPLLAPKKIIEEYHGLIDTMLRVDTLPSAPGQPQTRVYWTGGTIMPPNANPLAIAADHALWRVKNREGCNDLFVPADLRAFLRKRTPPYANI